MTEISTASVRAGRRRRLRAAAVFVAAMGVVGVVGASVNEADAARPPSSVTTGAAVVSNTRVTPGGVGYTIVSSSKGVTVSGRYSVGSTGTAIDQIQIGWAGSSVPLGCIFNGSGDQSGTFSYNLGVPPDGQVNQVIVNFAQDYGCLATYQGWWSSNQGPAVAEVAERPPNSGVNGIATLSHVALNTSSNVVVARANRPVTLSGSYAIAQTGGAIDQVEVGWQGSDTPAACIYNGGGGTSGTFNVTLPAPPHAGANYVVFEAAQYFSCNLSRWWQGSSTPPAAAPVALYYNTSIPATTP